MMIDRQNCPPTIIASRHEGMDIEAVSNNDLESVVKLRFDYNAGITADMIESVANALVLRMLTSQIYVRSWRKSSCC